MNLLYRLLLGIGLIFITHKIFGGHKHTGAIAEVAQVIIFLLIAIYVIMGFFFPSW